MTLQNIIKVLTSHCNVLILRLFRVLLFCFKFWTKPSCHDVNHDHEMIWSGSKRQKKRKKSEAHNKLQRLIITKSIENEWDLLPESQGWDPHSRHHESYKSLAFLLSFLLLLVSLLFSLMYFKGPSPICKKAFGYKCLGMWKWFIHIVPIQMN